ncbi:MAG: tetratricopeptide repeat protein [Rickettsiales bacterium]|nr:tetratricopeptide repeat protein [Rickettsiales bacterium]
MNTFTIGAPMQPEPAATPQADIQMAMQLQNQGRLDEAQAAYTTLMQLQPHNADLSYLMGAVLMQKEQLLEAVHYLKTAYQSDKMHKHYANLYATALLRSDKQDEAFGVFAEALTYAPNNQNLLQNFVREAFANNRHDLAEQVLGRIVENSVGNNSIRWVYAQCCSRVGKYQEAYEHIHHILTATNGIPTEQMIREYSVSALCLNDETVFNEALDVLKGLKGHSKAVKEIWQMRSLMFMHGHRFHEAVSELDELSTLSKRTLQTDAEKGMCLLTKTNLVEGFELFNAQQNILKYCKADFFVPAPRWKGESLKDKRIMIGTEHGVGGVIMWLGLLPHLLEQGAQVSLAILEKLHPLIARSFPEVKLYGPEDVINNDDFFDEEFDYHCPISELMTQCLKDYTPAEHEPYLKADEKKTKALRKKYLAANKAKKLIGISWSTENENSAYRRNIDLETWLPLLQNDEEVQFVSLQYDKREAEVEAINAKLSRPIIFDEEQDPKTDVDVWSAQIAAMDEVITIQNTTAHIAGALGIPTTLLLSSYGCWRWGHSGDNKWYASVDIARQQPFEGWNRVMKRLLGKRKES